MKPVRDFIKSRKFKDGEVFKTNHKDISLIYYLGSIYEIWAVVSNVKGKQVLYPNDTFSRYGFRKGWNICFKDKKIDGNDYHSFDDLMTYESKCGELLIDYREVW